MAKIDKFDLLDEIKENVLEALNYLSDEIISLDNIIVNEPSMKRLNYVIILLPLKKYFSIPLEELSNYVGSFICFKMKEISGYNTTKGFINLELSNDFMLDRFYCQCCTITHII